MAAPPPPGVPLRRSSRTHRERRKARTVEGMKRLLALAATAPTALVFADVALKYGLTDTMHALGCVVQSGAQLSATPVALIAGVMLLQSRKQTTAGTLQTS
jgi:hypothetical protein